MRKNTKIIHSGGYIDGTGSVSMPIYHASTYRLDDVDAIPKYEYSRTGNPTRETLERLIADLEEGNHGFAFSSGMAAISSVFMIFSAGDHIIVSKDVYGGTYRVLKEVFENFNLQISYVDLTNIDDIEKNIMTNTKAVYMECPTNPMLQIVDIKKIALIAKKHGIISIIDNTFMTPYLQRPLVLGVDIAIHSATKYIGGHSDVLAGLIAVRDEKLAAKIYMVQKSVGAVLSPQDCWLLLRGVKTLGVRMDRHLENTKELAYWLRDQSFVKKVYYPGFEDHKGYEICKSQADGFGAVVSFDLINEDLANRLVKGVKYITLGASLGGVESLISIPAKMSHASMAEEERVELGITPSLIRLSVGIEDVEDIKEDITQALYII